MVHLHCALVGLCGVKLRAQFGFLTCQRSFAARSGSAGRTPDRRAGQRGHDRGDGAAKAGRRRQGKGRGERLLLGLSCSCVVFEPLRLLLHVPRSIRPMTRACRFVRGCVRIVPRAS